MITYMKNIILAEVTLIPIMAFYSCSSFELYLILYKILKNMGARRVLALWALEWTWHPAESNLRCSRSLRSLIPKF